MVSLKFYYVSFRAFRFGCCICRRAGALPATRRKSRSASHYRVTKETSTPSRVRPRQTGQLPSIAAKRHRVFLQLKLVTASETMLM